MIHRLITVFTVITVAGLVFAQPPGPPNLDHFDCYVTEAPVQPVTALLFDQFAPATAAGDVVKDIRLVRFCNPVQKTLRNGKVTQIQHPDAHLALYVINPQPAVPRQLTVLNQFGGQVLDTGNAIILAVPSGKAPIPATGVVPNPPPIPDPKELDHFECYIASGKRVGTVVSLKDQFQTEFTRVLQPILFCNPVRKVIPPTPVSTGSTTPILNPIAHLTCYIKTPTPFQTVVVYNNQFVRPTTANTPAIAQLFNSDILCVPSLKLRWTVIQPPTSFGAPDDNNDQ
jgi:hypothetical protein